MHNPRKNNVNKRMINYKSIFVHCHFNPWAKRKIPIRNQQSGQVRPARDFGSIHIAQSDP